MNSIPAGFAPLRNRSPFLKLVVYGEPGSGKTRFLATVAVGLWKRLGATAPVGFLDTEDAAAHTLPIFEAAGVPVLAQETRHPTALSEAMQATREGALSILVVDCYTHFRETFEAQWAEAHGIKSRPLSPAERGDLNADWRRLVDEHLRNDAAHYLVAGRAASEYETTLDQDTQRRESFRSGIRMARGAETAYEAGLLVRLERRELAEGGGVRVFRSAFVEKDRTGAVDGRELNADGKLAGPSYEEIAPAVDRVLANAAEKLAPVLRAPSVVGGASTASRERDRERRRQILLEEIDSWLDEAFPGSGRDVVRDRGVALGAVFGTESRTYRMGLALEELEAKHGALRSQILSMTATPRPSKKDGPPAPPPILRTVAPETSRVSARAASASVASPSVAARLGLPEDVLDSPAGGGASPTDHSPSLSPPPASTSIPAASGPKVQEPAPSPTTNETFSAGTVPAGSASSVEGDGAGAARAAGAESSSSRAVGVVGPATTVKASGPAPAVTSCCCCDSRQAVHDAPGYHDNACLHELQHAHRVCAACWPSVKAQLDAHRSTPEREGAAQAARIGPVSGGSPDGLHGASGSDVSSRNGEACSATTISPGPGVPGQRVLSAAPDGLSERRASRGASPENSPAALAGNPAGSVHLSENVNDIPRARVDDRPEPAGQPSTGDGESLRAFLARQRSLANPWCPACAGAGVLASSEVCSCTARVASQAPAPLPKLTLAAFVARVGADDRSKRWAKYLLAHRADDVARMFCEEILSRAEKVHGAELVQSVFAKVGGRRSGGPKSKRMPLTVGQLSELVLELPVIATAQDRQNQEREVVQDSEARR